MSKYEELVAELAPRKFNKKGVIWTVSLVIISLIGIAAYIDQIIQGQVVTNMRDYVLWGVYISNFVFFVAISFVGSLTAAALRLSRSTWRTPLVRIQRLLVLPPLLWQD